MQRIKEKLYKDMTINETTDMVNKVGGEEKWRIQETEIARVT